MAITQQQLDDVLALVDAAQDAGTAYNTARAIADAANANAQAARNLWNATIVEGQADAAALGVILQQVVNTQQDSDAKGVAANAANQAFSSATDDLNEAISELIYPSSP